MYWTYQHMLMSVFIQGESALLWLGTLSQFNEKKSQKCIFNSLHKHYLIIYNLVMCVFLYFTFWGYLCCTRL